MRQKPQHRKNIRERKALIHLKKGLRTKIIIWYFIPTCIILLLVALVAVIAFQKTTETSVLERSQQTTSLIANQLTTTLNDYLEPLISLTFNSDLQSGDIQKQHEILVNAKQYAFNIAPEDQKYVGIALLDAHGRLVMAEPTLLGIAGEDWSQRPYFQDAMNLLKNDAYVRPLISNVQEEKNLPYLHVVVGVTPLLNSDNVLQGVITLFVPIISLNLLEITEADTLDSGIVFVVDSQGRIVYHPDTSYIGWDFSGLEQVQRVKNAESGSLRTHNFAGDSIVAGYAPMSGTPWGVVTEINWKELYSRTVGYRVSLWFLLAVATIFPIVFVTMGIKKIIHPLTELMRAVDGVSSGNFEQITTIHTGDEIEELANQFNNMATQVQSAYTILEKKVTARTHELATLNAIAAVVSHSLELDDILSATLDEVLMRLDAQVGCIHTLDANNQTLNLHVHRGMGADWCAAVHQLAPGEGISGSVIIEQQPVVVNVDDYATLRIIPFIQEQGIQTLAATPILLQGEIFGTLALGTQQARTFPPEEHAMLAAIGQQIGVGVENAHLYRQAQQELIERKRAQERLRWVSEERARRNRELLLLNRVIAATTSQLEPQAVLEAVCHELVLAFDIPQAAVAMLDADRYLLTVMAEYRRDNHNLSSLGAVIPVEGNPSTQYILANKVPLAMSDAQHDPRLAPARDLMIVRGVQSVLLLPLIVRGEVIGTVGLDSFIKHEFTQEEINLATSATAAAAQALEKARAEEDLRDSESRYRELFNSSPIGIFRTHLSGQILDANPTLLHMLGFNSVEEGNRVGLHNFYADPADHQRLMALLKENPATNFETRFRRGDGRIIHVSMRVTLTYTETGTPEFLQGTLVDITEKHEAETALRESRERLQLAIEGAGLGLWDLNLLTGEQVLNRDWWSDLGYAECENDATSGDTSIYFDELAELVHPADRDKMADAFNDHLAGQVPLYEVEFRLKTQAGAWLWMLMRGKSVAFDENHKPLRMAGISQNITARKQAQAAMRASEERLKVAMEAAGLGLFDQNLTTNELLLSHYGATSQPTSCGMEDASTTIAKLVDRLHPDDKPQMADALHRHIHGDAPLYEVEFRIPHQESEWRWQLHRGKIVAWDEDGQPTRITGIHEDITARKLAEAELHQAKEDAEAANRAKSVFLANMSHELRTPLNAILGFTQLMDRDPLITSAQRENLETISRSGQHLLTLINDVLEMSKIEAGRTTIYEENFDLYRMLNALEDMFTLRATEKSLQLLFERAPNVPQYIRTDESKLRQALINLLSNAIKFTHEGGVTLRVKCDKYARDAPPVPRLPDEYYIYFEIEDTGMGIAPHDLDALFDPFVQTASGQESKEGTGLGLPISQQYVQLMGGNLSVESTIAHSSRFFFHIPVALADASDIQAEPERRRVIGVKAGQPTYRLLIAEDKWTNRQLLRRLLAPLSFELREAENGQEAIDLWAEWQPHLIWMDMRMPVLDGHEATRRIKATTQGQATVIIAITASAFEEDRRIILSEGCDDFVRKPFREAEIFGALEKHLGVEFIYDETGPLTPAQTEQEIQEAFTVEALAALPVAWVDALYKGAVSVDSESILALADQIRPQNTPLADALRNLVHEFRFDIIMETAQPR